MTGCMPLAASDGMLLNSTTCTRKTTCTICMSGAGTTCTCDGGDVDDVAVIGLAGHLWRHAAREAERRAQVQLEQRVPLVWVACSQERNTGASYIAVALKFQAEHCKQTACTDRAHVIHSLHLNKPCHVIKDMGSLGGAARALKDCRAVMHASVNHQDVYLPIQTLCQVINGFAVQQVHLGTSEGIFTQKHHSLADASNRT